MQQISLPYLRQPANWWQMENGHQILLIPKAGEVVHWHTVVRAGSLYENNTNNGISHFLEHLMFKGTPCYPAGKFDRMLEAVGARVNASTSKDFTQYYITLPAGNNGDFSRMALELHADMLLNAALPESEIGPPFTIESPPAEKRERMVVIEEIKMGMDNPMRQAMQQLNELLYPTHPYRREVIGTAEIIASIPQQTIVDYYRQWYQPANMITIVSGDFAAQQICDEIAQAFNFPSPTPLPIMNFAAELPPAEPRIIRTVAPLNVSYILLAFLGPPASDLRTGIALDVISLILGEGDSSRINQRLVEQLPNSPFFEAGTAHWSHRESSNLLCFGVARPDASEEAFDLLRAEIARLQQEVPTAAEIAKAVTRLETSFAAQAETTAGLCGGIADSMARLNNPAAYIDYLPILKSLTADEISAAITRILADSQLCAVLVAPAGKD